MQICYGAHEETLCALRRSVDRNIIGNRVCLSPNGAVAKTKEARLEGGLSAHASFALLSPSKLLTLSPGNQKLHCYSEI